MKIALVQLDIVWESKKINCDRAEFFIKKALQENCDIIAFPEMFNTGFSMNVAAIAEDENGKTALYLSRMAKRYGINLIAGFATKAFKEKKGRNMAFVYDRKGELVSKFTKLHPFSLSNEDRYYIPGRDTVTFNLDGMPSSIFICYDLRFPEVFRKIAREVQSIFVIANWPTARKEQWELLLKARALENQCFVIGVNRIGTDGNGIRYPGASHIYNPSGIDICSGGEKEEFVTGIINPDDVNTIRSNFPVLEDMRYLTRDIKAKQKGIET